MLIVNGADIFDFNNDAFLEAIESNQLDAIKFLLSFCSEDAYIYSIHFSSEFFFANFGKKYHENRRKVIRECRDELSTHHVRLYIYLVMICDGYFKIGGLKSFHKDYADLIRFVKIAIQLPAELQNNICNQVYKRIDKFITCKNVKNELRYFVFMD